MIPWEIGLGILIGAIVIFGLYMWMTPRDRIKDK